MSKQARQGKEGGGRQHHNAPPHINKSKEHKRPKKQEKPKQSKPSGQKPPFCPHEQAGKAKKGRRRKAAPPHVNQSKEHKRPKKQEKLKQSMPSGQIHLSAPMSKQARWGREGGEGSTTTHRPKSMNQRNTRAKESREAKATQAKRPKSTFLPPMSKQARQGREEGGRQHHNAPPHIKQSKEHKRPKKQEKPKQSKPSDQNPPFCPHEQAGKVGKGRRGKAAPQRTAPRQRIKGTQGPKKRQKPMQSKPSGQNPPFCPHEQADKVEKGRRGKAAPQRTTRHQSIKGTQEAKEQEKPKQSKPISQNPPFCPHEQAGKVGRGRRGKAAPQRTAPRQ